MERENEVITPVAYYTYKPVTITVVTKTVKTGVINGVPQYRYETAETTYYLQDQQLSSDTQIEVDAYAAVTLTLPYTAAAISPEHARQPIISTRARKLLRRKRKPLNIWNAPFIPLIIR